MNHSTILKGIHTAMKLLTALAKGPVADLQNNADSKLVVAVLKQPKHQPHRNAQHTNLTAA
jgi:hypothetical protein